MVLEVGADTGEVDDDGNVELLQLLGGTDTGKLQQLGRVVGSTGDDDFAGGLGRSGNTLLALVLGAGLVEVLAIEELDTCGARSLLSLVESDLGNVCVQSDVKRVLLCAVGVLQAIS